MGLIDPSGTGFSLTGWMDTSDRGIPISSLFSWLLHAKAYKQKSEQDPGVDNGLFLHPSSLSALCRTKQTDGLCRFSDVSHWESNKKLSQIFSINVNI